MTIAIENLAPVYPGPERLSDAPLVLRAARVPGGARRDGLTSPSPAARGSY